MTIDKKRTIVLVILCAIIWGVLLALAVRDNDAPPADLFQSPFVARVFLPLVARAPECPPKPAGFGVCRQAVGCAELVRLNVGWYVTSYGDQYAPEEVCPGFEWGVTMPPYLAYPHIIAQWDRKPYTPQFLMFGNEWNHKYFGVEPNPPEAAALMLPILQEVAGAGGVVAGPFPASGDNAWWGAFWDETLALGWTPDWRQVRVGVHCYGSSATCEAVLWDAAETFQRVFNPPSRIVAGRVVPVEPVVILGEHGMTVWGSTRNVDQADAENRALWTEMYFGDLAAVVDRSAYWSLGFGIGPNAPCPDRFHCWIPAYEQQWRGSDLVGWKPLEPIWGSLCDGPQAPTQGPMPRTPPRSEP